MLAKAVGGALKVAAAGEAPGSRRLYYGIPPAGEDVSRLDAQEFVTTVEANGDIRLYGGGTNGTRNAAYDYLQASLGFRFFDWRDGMRVPDLRGYVPRPASRRRRMSFEHRGTSQHWHFNGPGWARYELRHGINRGIEETVRAAGVGAAANEILTPSPWDASLVTYL